jgi:hypothetical protein
MAITVTLQQGVETPSCYVLPAQDGIRKVLKNLAGFRLSPE